MTHLFCYVFRATAYYDDWLQGMFWIVTCIHWLKLTLANTSVAGQRLKTDRYQLMVTKFGIKTSQEYDYTQICKTRPHTHAKVACQILK